MNLAAITGKLKTAPLTARFCSVSEKPSSSGHYEALEELRERAAVFGPDFTASQNWRCFQDIVRTYFAQHPEVTL